MLKFKPEKELKEEWKNQIDYFANKCGFTKQEKKLIVSLSLKFNIPPQRIIETIGVNAHKGKLNPDDIEKYKLAINEFKKINEKNKEILNQIPKENNILSRINIFSEEAKIKNEIEANEKRINNYTIIAGILEAAITKPELVKKIYEKTNYKPFGE